MAVAAQQPVPAQVVGDAFVQQYYHILHHNPGLVHRFYQDSSKLGRPEVDGSMSITSTMQAINEKVVSLNYQDFMAQIKSIHAQESLGGGVQVLVTGCLTGKDDAARCFAQTFFLAPQDKGYFVLNDIFKYVDLNYALVNDYVVPVESEPVPAVAAAPVLENHVSEASSPSAQEAIAGDVYDPPENGDVPIAEEVAVSEVVDEVQNVVPMVVETMVKIEDIPKKSYASIVKDLKESAASFSPPPDAPLRAPPKKLEPVSPTLDPLIDELPSAWDSADNESNQESEVYVKGLLMDATESLLEEVFAKFGTIKINGIQIRFNRQYNGFCFGFVEYEEASSLEKALEASPATIGGRRVYVEEKRSNFRGNNRGRFQPGRGSGSGNEVGRVRGNHGGGRSYTSRGDFNDRGGEYGHPRDGFRGASSNRGGYQRSDSFNSDGDRMNNRAGGPSNRSMAPRVRVTA